MASIKINGESSGSTTISAPASGGDETIELSTVLDDKAPLASPTFTGTPALPDGTTLAGSLLTSGKILQIVRATDSTNRSTTSTSLVDAGISVTITPQKSDSVILLIWHTNCQGYQVSGQNDIRLAITDNSNNTIGGEKRLYLNSTGSSHQIDAALTLISYSTPATTSATTYKGRFRAVAATGFLQNGIGEGQFYAIEVSA